MAAAKWVATLVLKGVCCTILCILAITRDLAFSDLLRKELKSF